MSQSIYKRYSIRQRQDVATSGEKEIISAVAYDFGCTAGVASCLPPVIHNVMGQEDKYRESPVNVRVNNGGTARIVFTTEFNGSSKIYCDPDPGSGVAPTTLEVDDATLETYHEKFFSGLSVDTLYKFYVRSINACGDEISEYYYLLTGGELDISSGDFVIEFSNEILTVDVSGSIEIPVTVSVDQVTQSSTVGLVLVISDDVGAIDVTQAFTQDQTNLYTNTVVI